MKSRSGRAQSRRWVWGFLIGILLGGGLYYLGGHDPAPVDPEWALGGSEAVPAGAVTVRWTGTSTLVISDGDTTLVTDGWFSRPGILRWVLGSLSPDLAAIEQGLSNNQLSHADVVFALHAHHDHVQDAPEVARRTGAILMGSPSVAMVGRGWGLPEDRIQVVTDGEVYRYGAFRLTPILTYHAPTLTEGGQINTDYEQITAPLVPPVSIQAYKVGASYSLLLEHPRGSIMITGSAGYREGALAGHRADIYLWGMGGLSGFSEHYRDAYWRETVGYIRPRQLIPIHWDALTGPIEGPFRGQMRLINRLIAGPGEAQAVIDEINYRAAAAGIGVATLPRYAPVVLFP